MTLSVDIKLSRSAFELKAAFNTSARFVSLFGHSGAGKTTFLNCLAGLARPQTGHISVDGRVLVDTQSNAFVPPYKRSIGYVFQDARLFPHMSVRANLEYGVRRARNENELASFDDVVDLLGLHALVDRRPLGLSGGEAQRVAIGRALRASPSLLLLDEPFASIDANRRAELLPYLERIRDDIGLPIVHVSHASDEVLRLADEVVWMAEGKVVAAGPINEVFADTDRLTATGDFDAGVSLVATVSAVDAATGLCQLQHPAGSLVLHDPSLVPGTQVRVRIRARDVAIAIGEVGELSLRNRLVATVTHVRIEGGFADLRLDCAGDPLVARLTMDAVRDLDLRLGSAVTALIKTAAIGNRSGEM